MDYTITTDSNSDVPAEVLKKYGIPVIPQYYAFGDEVYGDEKNMSPHEFYETMRKENFRNPWQTIRQSSGKNLRRF